MEEKEDVIIISKGDYAKKEFEINNKKIIIKNANINKNDIQMTNNEQENENVWVSFTNKLVESQTDTILKDYKTRTNIIDMIVNKSIDNNINGVVIEFNNIQDKNSFYRFIIELVPKLREVGLNTVIVLNKNIEKEDYKNLVDYIVE